MEPERTEGRVANGLLLLALALLIGLLDLPYASLVAAVLPLVGAVIVVFAKPLGNRLLAFGLALLAALLLLARWRFMTFFPMLLVLGAVILLGAGVLKHKGKW